MQPSSTIETDNLNREEYMDDLETKINTEIGYRFWKKYVNAAFWSYISLPINLSITMMTALSTGQATTDNLLPKNLYINISLATLVISVLNTYFRPYVQMNQNIEYMNKWSVLGCQFEEIYYSENHSIDHTEHRIVRYETLLKNINDLKKAEILETQNFLTDSIHLALRSCYCCLKNKNRWLALDETLKAENTSAKNRLDFPPTSPSPSGHNNFGYMGEIDALIREGIPPPIHEPILPVSPEMEKLYLEFSEHSKFSGPRSEATDTPSKCGDGRSDGRLGGKIPTSLQTNTTSNTNPIPTPTPTTNTPTTPIATDFPTSLPSLLPSPHFEGVSVASLRGPENFDEMV